MDVSRFKLLTELCYVLYSTMYPIISDPVIGLNYVSRIVQFFSTIILKKNVGGGLRMRTLLLYNEDQ